MKQIELKSTPCIVKIKTTFDIEKHKSDKTNRTVEFADKIYSEYFIVRTFSHLNILGSDKVRKYRNSGIAVQECMVFSIDFLCIRTDQQKQHFSSFCKVSAPWTSLVMYILDVFVALYYTIHLTPLLNNNISKDTSEFFAAENSSN